MDDVADDAAFESLEGTEFLLDGHQVEQGLGRMASRSITGVKDGHVDVLKLGVVLVLTVADNHAVEADRLQGFDRVV